MALPPRQAPDADTGWRGGPPLWFDDHDRERRTHANSNTLIAIAGEVRRITDKGIELYTGLRTVWLPRSQIVKTETGVEMPEWFAQKHNLP